MEISNGIKKIFDNLSEEIFTEDDLIFFIEEVNRIREEVFKSTKTSLSQKIRGKVKEDLRNNLEKLEKEEIGFKSPKKQFSFLNKLKEYLQGLPQIKLEFAFSPNKDFILKINDWLKKETGQRIILDITVKPEIGGGAIIEYQGQYRNFTLSKEIDKLIAQGKLYG